MVRWKEGWVADPLSESAKTLHEKVAEAETPGGEGGVTHNGKDSGVLHGWTEVERAAGLCESTAALCTLWERAAQHVRADV